MPRADPSETAAECEQVVWGFLFSTGEAREADLRRNFFEAAARRIAYETYSFDLMLDIEDHAKNGDYDAALVSAFKLLDKLLKKNNLLSK